MDSEAVVDRWPKRLTGLFLVGACLALLIPAGAHQGLLPFGLESRWVWSSLFGGVACCLVAFVGFMVLALRRGKARREVFIFGALVLLLGVFLVMFAAPLALG